MVHLVWDSWFESFQLLCYLQISYEYFFMELQNGPQKSTLLCRSYVIKNVYLLLS